MRRLIRKLINSEQVEEYVVFFFISLLLLTFAALLGFFCSLFFILLGQLHPIVSLIVSSSMCLFYVCRGVKGLREQKSFFEIGVGDEFAIAGAIIIGLYLTTLVI